MRALPIPEFPPATAGEIAIGNHESCLERCWEVLRRGPDRPGTIGQIIDEEHRRSHFLGDVTALDRLAALSTDIQAADPLSAEAHLCAARIAAMLHRFEEATSLLVKAEALGAPDGEMAYVRLTIDQALGLDLEAVLAERLELAGRNRRLQDLVPIGAVLVDLGAYEDADRAYVEAITGYRDLSPFPLAWVCFQLGTLWGELAPDPDLERASRYYRQALAYVPSYTHALVHLAEIELASGRPATAEALLLPALGSGDPEVAWRLSEVYAAQERTAEAETQRVAADVAFEALLARHELAFADHAAEFHLALGDAKRALHLAKVNLRNRPTLRAFELAHAAAAAALDMEAASDVLMQARARLGHHSMFRRSTLAAALANLQEAGVA
jgi:tetratricopeptide (TPR) repeat protein